jgi:hypothetical protein
MPAMRHTRPARRRLALVLLGLPGGALGAQDALPAAPACAGRTVSAVVVTTRAPSFLAFPRRLRPLARGAGLHHTTTRPDVVRRFLLLRAGEPCTERRRAESERVLRVQPFLAAATVRAVAEPDGRTRIEVETVDEIPTVAGLGVRGGSPSRLRLGNGNVGGQGVYLAGHAERGFGYRPGVGLRAVHHAAFGGPVRVETAAERTPLGGGFTVTAGHAFLTDLQRVAWHVGYGAERGYASVTRPDGDALSLGLRRRLWDAGGVRRVGVGRFRAFVGGLVTGEHVGSARAAVVVTDTGLVADTGATLRDRYAAFGNVRLNAVLGVRALAFMPVRGFDALAAVQDVATGVQLGTLVGWGVPRLGASDSHRFLSADLYAGGGSATSFVAVRVAGEARQPLSTHRWDAVAGSARLAWYVKPAATSVIVAGAELSGGTRTRIPLQLALGARDGGVRGYAASRAVGAVRAVARLEERWTLARPRGRAALGIAGFVDAGKVWAGDAPFGVDDRVRTGIGVGLLAAAPVESKRLWRLDLAVPVNPDARARRPEVRFTTTLVSGFWREPRDVARVRAGAAPSTIFTWP